jgi:hypothetical protein
MMRDVKRISRIMGKLEWLWRLHPDQRFGQLLYNYIYPVNGNVNWHEECAEVERRLDDALGIMVYVGEKGRKAYVVEGEGMMIIRSHHPFSSSDELEKCAKLYAEIGGREATLRAEMARNASLQSIFDKEGYFTISGSLFSDLWKVKLRLGNFIVAYKAVK